MFVTQSEAARVEGVSRQWINQLIKSRRLTRDANGKVDLVEVRRLRAEGLDPGRGAHKHGGASVRAGSAAVPSVDGAGKGPTFLQARTAREAYNAKLAELELQERLGALVRKDDVERETFAVQRALRDRLTGIPDRIAPMLAAEGDVAKCHAIVANEIRVALRDVVASLAEPA